MVGRANQTLAFEDDELNQVIPISTDDVLKEYWKEQGYNSCIFKKKPKPGGIFDNGLVVLNSLNLWRKNGWIAAGHKYRIYAFAAVDVFNHPLVKTGNFLLNGLLFGISLPLTAQDQVGKVWEVVNGPGNEPNSWGGHLVFNKDYPDGQPNVITWGNNQEMTWGFAEKYCDEVYAVVDDKDSKSSVLDITLLKSYLDACCKNE
jgi:hypothetical protein